MMCNLIGTTKEEIEENISKAGGTIEDTTCLEKGHIAVKLQENRVVESVCDLKYWFVREKVSTCIPNSMLQGSARVLIRNLHSSTLAVEIIDFVEVEGVKALDLHVTWRKLIGNFTGLLKATLLAKTQ